MRYFLLSGFFASVAALSLACGSGDAENSNTNTNQTPAVNMNAAENTNTNAIKVDEPVPTFSDAPTALTEGSKYLEASEYDKAVEAYKQAVKLDPELADAHFQLGIAYGLVEKQQETQEDKLPGEEDEDASKKKSKKRVEEKKTNSEISFENAIKIYKKITAKNPKDDAAFYNLGRAYNKLNDDKEAQKALQTAVKLQPENGEYQTEFGTILIKLAQYDEAIRALKKAVEIDETNLRAAELLEQAEAGKKRVDFGANQIKSKQPTQQDDDDRETRSAPKNKKETEKTEGAEPPKQKPTP